MLLVISEAASLSVSPSGSPVGPAESTIRPIMTLIHSSISCTMDCICSEGENGTIGSCNSYNACIVTVSINTTTATCLSFLGTFLVSHEVPAFPFMAATAVNTHASVLIEVKTLPQHLPRNSSCSNGCSVMPSFWCIESQRMAAFGQLLMLQGDLSPREPRMLLLRWSCFVNDEPHRKQRALSRKASWHAAPCAH